LALNLNGPRADLKSALRIAAESAFLSAVLPPVAFRPESISFAVS